MARYIDAEKIEIKCQFGMRDDVGILCVPLRDVKKSIENTPTADVVEVKHGEWENFEIPHMMRCSECGVSDLDIHRTKFAFCPYCGAKMDGGDSE